MSHLTATLVKRPWHSSCLACTFRLPDMESSNKGTLPDRCDTCAICRTEKVPVFSPRQARWYSWSSHTTKKLKIMNNPLSNLQLDVWYKVLIVICTVVFLSTAGGLLPKLPTNSALLISLGGVFFCCGEWKNHPRHTVVEEAMGQRFLGTGFKRAFSITGTILCLIGGYLIYRGIMPLL